jgi:hypothetical protein
LESHRHLDISTIDSFVLLTFSFVIRFSATGISHVVHLRILRRQLRRKVDNSRLIEPATDVYRDMFIAEHLPVHGVKDFSRLADPLSYIYHVSEFRHEKSSLLLELEAEGHKAVVVDFNILCISSR